MKIPSKSPEYLNHVAYLNHLSDKEEKLVYNIFGRIRKESHGDGVKTIKWTAGMKLAVNIHRRTRKAQERKRIKNKTRNSRH